MRKSLASLLYIDEEMDDIRPGRDPVAKATPSPSAKRKKAIRHHQDSDWPLHSFDTLIAALGTRCRNRCRFATDPSSPPLYQLTEPTPFQTHVFSLLGIHRSQ